jgi:hypothetical protein
VKERDRAGEVASREEVDPLADGVKDRLVGCMYRKDPLS